jgi:Skp family chaperone for outer membrane proteins
MRKNFMYKAVFGLTLVAATAVIMVAVSGDVKAQNPPPAPPAQTGEQTGEDLVVGTYDAQRVFEQHPAQDKLVELSTSLQAKMQQAQESGDDMQVNQIQEEYSQQRDQIIEDFYSNVEKTIPVAAKKAGIKVVAMEIVYTADDVRTEDITSDVIETINGGN